MRKSHKLVVAAVAAAAGIAAIGATSAFTDSNSDAAITDHNWAGYSNTTASGVTITDVRYAVNGSDASKVDSVTFTTTEDVSTESVNAYLTLSKDDTATTATSCNTDTANTITCNFGGTAVDITSFDATALTVTSA